MIIEKLDLTDALEAGHELPYVWIHELSRVYIGKNTDVDLQLEEVEEVRFFDEKAEVKIVRMETELQAWRITAEPDDHVIRHSYAICNQEFGGKLSVTWMLDADEDGQTYVKGERLSGWEESGYGKQ